MKYTTTLDGRETVRDQPMFFPNRIHLSIHVSPDRKLVVSFSIGRIIPAQITTSNAELEIDIAIGSSSCDARF
jgi:hypothetical protein